MIHVDAMFTGIENNQETKPKYSEYQGEYLKEDDKRNTHDRMQPEKEHNVAEPRGNLPKKPFVGTRQPVQS